MATINIDGSSKEVQHVIAVLGEHYIGELTTILLGFYHKMANDSLTLDDLEGVATHYGLDLEKTYLELFMQADDECE